MKQLLLILMFVSSVVSADGAGENVEIETGAMFYAKAMVHFNEVGRYPDGLIHACSYFKKSSELSYPKSYYYTANCYSYGFLGEQGNINYLDAERYWQMSIESLGDEASRIALAKSFLHMPSRQEKYQQAVGLLNSSKDIDGQVEFLLCDILLTGKGVPPDPEQGMSCLQSLADNGNSVAQGALYHTFSNGVFGQGVDKVKAQKWWAIYLENPNKYILEPPEFSQYLKERCLFVPLEQCISWD